MIVIPGITAGDAITAAWLNRIVGQVNKHSHAMPGTHMLDGKGFQGGQHRPPIRLVRVKADMDEWVVDGTGQDRRFDSANEGTKDQWADAARQFGKIVAPDNAVYLEGEVVAAFFEGTSARWVPIPTQRFVIGKLDAALGQGSSASMTVWQRNSGDTDFEATSPAIQVTVYDWLMKVGETDVSSGKKVAAIQCMGHKYILVGAECE